MVQTKRIYQFAEVLSALSLVGIAVLILAQIVARLGGTQIPSADDFAAWSMASAVFLALPNTLLKGGHIRVTILFNAFGSLAKRVMDMIATIVAIGISAWGTWFVGEYVYESYTYHDVSQGIIAVPLWIPQCSMLIGIALLTLALLEHFIGLIRGESPLESPDAENPEQD